MSGTLSHSPADIVREVLIDTSNPNAEVIGTDPDNNASWPIYAYRLPTTPNDAILVSGTAGIKQGRLMQDGEVQEKYGIQIMVRAEDETDGETKARTIITRVDTVINRTSITLGVVTYTVHNLSRVSDVLSLGTEPEGVRWLFTINLLAVIRP